MTHKSHGCRALSTGDGVSRVVKRKGARAYSPLLRQELRVDFGEEIDLGIPLHTVQPDHQPSGALEMLSPCHKCLLSAREKLLRRGAAVVQHEPNWQNQAIVRTNNQFWHKG
jgi:hypothetical protein